jgi:hypothetical protein
MLLLQPIYWSVVSVFVYLQYNTKPNQTRLGFFILDLLIKTDTYGKQASNQSSG